MPRKPNDEALQARPIFISSPQMLSGEVMRRVGHQIKELHFPFQLLEVGQSFEVKFDETSEGSLRNNATRHSKHGKQFRVIKHAESFEVGRIK